VKKFIDIQKQPDDRLRITIREGFHNDVAALSARTDIGEDDKLRALFHWYFLHGWQEIAPETVGVLTSALLLTDDARLRYLYYNPLYAVQSEIATLLETGELLFSVVFME